MAEEITQSLHLFFLSTFYHRKKKLTTNPHWYSQYDPKAWKMQISIILTLLLLPNPL